MESVLRLWKCARRIKLLRRLKKRDETGMGQHMYYCNLLHLQLMADPAIRLPFAGGAHRPGNPHVFFDIEIKRDEKSSATKGRVEFVLCGAKPSQSD